MSDLVLPKVGNYYQAYKKKNRQEPRRVMAITLDPGYASGISIEWRGNSGGCVEALSAFMAWVVKYEARA